MPADKVFQLTPKQIVKEAGKLKAQGKIDEFTNETIVNS
jgi:hypothetical protein